MEKYLKKLLLFLIIIASIACENKKIGSNNISGVVITFDDRYIDQWYSADSILKEYNWKATFFVTTVYMLNSSQLIKMRELKQNGNEIGGHGFHHYNAVNFVDTSSLNNYLKADIIPMLNIFASLGYQITSFAYPYGARTSEIDTFLFQKFDFVAGTDRKSKLIENQKCFYNYQKLIYRFPLDYNYYGDNWNYIDSLLNYALENNKIVIFYSHCPTETIERDYQITFDKLEKICQFVQTNKMKFYTVSDLRKLTYKQE